MASSEGTLSAPEPLTREQAEQAGWDFVHEQEEQQTVVADGLLKITPAVFRAERKMNGTMQQAQGQSEEEVLQAVTFIEAVQQSVPPNGPATFDVSGLPKDRELDEEPLKTVYTDDDTFTEQEWSARARTDTIVTSEGQQFFSGIAADGNAEAIEAMDAASEQIAEASAAAEQEATSEEPLESKQIVYDTADAIDSPGQSAGGTLIIPEDADDAEAAAAAMAETSAAAENQRVLDAQEAADNAVIVSTAGSPTLDAMDAEHAAAAGGGEPNNATPAARKLAEAENVDLNSIEGTGEGGKITKGDVEGAING